MEQVVKKSNKENAKPACDSKKHGITSVVPKHSILGKSTLLQPKRDLEEANSVREGDVRAKTNTKTNPNKRQTLSQAFHTQQSAQIKRLVEEVQKQHSTILQKSKPGTYKGRVVQSKIDCFRKPATDAKPTEKKQDVIKTELPKVRSKSVTSLPASSKPAFNPASRSKSVSDVPEHAREKTIQRSVSQKTIHRKVPGPVCATSRAPPRPAPLTTGRPVSSKPIASKRNEAMVRGAKPKSAPAATEQKVCKPVTSTLSQYRMQMQTADERRAKLADWLASKGKTLKRPPVSGATTNNSRKPAPQVKFAPKPSFTQPAPVTKPAPLVKFAPKPSITQPAPVTKTESVKPAPGVKLDVQNDAEVPENKPVHSSRSSNIMNTTLDLLDNSDMDLPVDPEIHMESLVINLCDKLEAMETPSSCKDDEKLEEQETDKLFEILEEEELTEDEDTEEAVIICEQNEPKKERYNNEDEDGEEDARPTTPEMEGASIVKYSVKTTPYLQSVKKRIECETAPGSGSRRKSTIKDLKFLTPVRRSTRIQRKSSRLPDMLNDHDTCVSSLAELVQLEDADENAYIYRKNPALLEDLPDQPGDFGKVCS